ncbi:putative C6 transcription factor [Geopyxis carbonaria]|nr:putative C6 transcription factor [Geopyxis carbonaria]
MANVPPERNLKLYITQAPQLMATLSAQTGIPMFAPNPNGMGGPPGPPYQYPQHYHQQPAPRQRTAIACRYCRRRKIRCSGFETSPDGRCANCMRFNQECVFTPVSSQTQAFVPAHALVVGRSSQLYGPQGQPLPAGYQAQGLEYHSHPPPPATHQPYRLPSPNGNGESDPRGYMHHELDRRGLPPLPPQPPPPPSNSVPYGRRSSAGDYPNHYAAQPPSPSSHLPPPHGPFAHSPPSIGGPASSTYGPAPNFGPGQVSGGYYPAPQAVAPAPPRPESPGSHPSSEEHPSVSPQPQKFHPPMMRPTSTGPSSPGGPIPPMQISDIIDPIDPNPPPLSQSGPHSTRSAADRDVLNRLNFRPGF